MCHTDIPPGQSAPNVDTEEVVVPLAGGEELPCQLVTGSQKGPGVLVVPDVHGRSPFYEHLSAVLAEQGYTALLADFFFRQGPLTEASKEAAFGRRGKLDETQSVADLDTALDWLKEKSGTDIVGIIGFCMGGTFVLDLASTRKDLAGVAYYGFPVPQAQLKQPPPHPMDIVSDLSGPVLAFWGDQDETVGMEHANKYIELASKTNPAFESEILGGLGHGFLGDADLSDPKDPAGGATWARTLEFFQEHVKSA